MERGSERLTATPTLNLLTLQSFMGALPLPPSPPPLLLHRYYHQIAYPNSVPGLSSALLKVQDTIPICANLVAQQAALAALRHAGRPFVDRCIAEMLPNRDIARDALSVLGEGAVKGGEGALYLWARLPSNGDGRPADDVAVVRWLVMRHGITVIPGSACGFPGHIRVAFANMPNEKYREAALRLKTGLQELLTSGMLDDAS